LHFAAWWLATGLGLLVQGIQPGSEVVVFVPNGIESVLFIWVSAIMRLTSAHIDPGALTTGRIEKPPNFIRTLKPHALISYSIESTQAIEVAYQNTEIVPPGVEICLDAAAYSDNWESLPALASRGTIKHLGEMFEA